MKITLFLVACFISATNLFSQNVGIGTENPGSTLTVAGSVSAGYRSVTGSSTLNASDYFLVYNGANSATITLPPALAEGSGNFKGRIYKIKNNSTANITIAANGSEKIDVDFSIGIPSGNATELISTGLLSGATWTVVSGQADDNIRKALESVGCASCVAYDAASTNTWIQITSAEYSALQNNLQGMGIYGATPALMSNAATLSFGGATTLTQNFTTMSMLPASYYVVALSFKTSSAIPANLSGLKFKLSNTGQSSGYFSSPSTTLPTVSTLAAQTIYYFALKRSSSRAPFGAASNMAMYQSATYQIGAIQSTGTNMFYGGGDISNPSNSSPTTMLFQVLATANRQW